MIAGKSIGVKGIVDQDLDEWDFISMSPPRTNTISIVLLSLLQCSSKFHLGSILRWEHYKYK
jgi:hypothetical protein